MRLLISLTFLISTLFSICSLSSSALALDWTGISNCGTYQVKGVGRLSDKGLMIVVNEKSQSEVTIIVPIENEAFLAPYVDKAMEASVLFTAKPKGSKAEGIIKEIKSRIPNPINPKDTGIKFISKAACK